MSTYGVANHDAVIWIIKNQFGRRNLSAYDRSILALKLKPVIAAKAKENMLAGIKSEDPIQIFGEGSSSQNETIQKAKPTAKERTTNAQIAKAAGVSDEKIEAQASPEIDDDGFNFDVMPAADDDANDELIDLPETQSDVNPHILEVIDKNGTHIFAVGYLDTIYRAGKRLAKGGTMVSWNLRDKKEIFTNESLEDWRQFQWEIETFLTSHG